MFKKTIICKACYIEFLYPKNLPSSNYILKCINCDNICEKKYIVNSNINEKIDFSNNIEQPNNSSDNIEQPNMSSTKLSNAYFQIQDYVKYINYIICVLLICLQAILVTSYFACINKNQNIFIYDIEKTKYEDYLSWDIRLHNFTNEFFYNPYLKIDTLDNNLNLIASNHIKIPNIKPFSTESIIIKSLQDSTIKFTICESIFEVIGLKFINSIIKVVIFLNYYISYISSYIKLLSSS